MPRPTTRRPSNGTVHRKKAVIAALTKTLGVVTPALKKVKVSRVTYYDWLKTDEEFAAEVVALKDVALDFAETELHKRIKEGREASTIFYLKTQGKKRGYIEKAELEHSGRVDGTGVLAVPMAVDAEQWGVLAAAQQAGLAGVKP